MSACSPILRDVASTCCCGRDRCGPIPTSRLRTRPVTWRAQGLARDVRAHVVQANWPNALNRPEESAHTGHSVCIAPTGEILFRLPEQGFGVGVFTLGEREYVWCGAGEGVPAMRTVAGGGA